MEKSIACCGLNCSICPAYIACRDDDQELREKAAREWSTFYGANIVPDEVNCNGCQSTGLLYKYCIKCAIRQCCRDHFLENCSQCSYYPCDQINSFFKDVPEARENLDALLK